MFPQGFATLIREWPGDLYNNKVIVQAVNDHLQKDPSNRTLLTTLAELWVTHQKDIYQFEPYVEAKWGTT